MVSKTLFSKATDNWSTPTDFYKELDREFNFDSDPCPLNADFDSLVDSTLWVGSVFINPPYSNIKGFLEKGLSELEKGRAKTLVYLIPARTDTKWFHQYIYEPMRVGVDLYIEVRFIKGRLKFGGAKNSAPFPSMLVIFKNEPNGYEWGGEGVTI